MQNMEKYEIKCQNVTNATNTVNEGLKMIFDNKVSISDEQAKLMREISLNHTLEKIWKAGTESQENITQIENSVSKLTKKLEIYELDMDIFKETIKNLKDEIRIDTREQETIQRRARARVYTVLSVKKYFNYFSNSDNDVVDDLVGKVISRLWSNFRKDFEISSYKDLKRDSYSDAMKYIEGWSPKIYI